MEQHTTGSFPLGRPPQTPIARITGSLKTMKSPSTTSILIPRLYLGTMSFGWFAQTSSPVDETVARRMLHRFVQFDRELSDKKVFHQSHAHDAGLPRVDTARIYAGGKTETILGRVLQMAEETQDDHREPSSRSWNAASLSIGTKAHPSQPHGLSRTGLQAQLQASQAAIQVESFGEYYLHQPDPNHSLLESLTYLHELVQAGTIQRIGMSNYHVSEMERVFALCETHGLTKPSVYQGLYNPLHRSVEQQLLPLLRRNNCAFVAYNPLAAGMLTGKHASLENVAPGRFHNNPNYLPRFYTPEYIQAMQLLQAAPLMSVQDHGHNDKNDEETTRDSRSETLSMVEAAFLWLLRHSALRADCGDGVLLGASSVAQLDENLNACRKACTSRLAPQTLEALDRAHALTQSSAFPYWRSYSADMPDRERLDPGAAYEASKK